MSSEREAPRRVPFASGPIQVLPAGLLGFLQLKSPAGRNPEVLNGDVQPVLDLRDLYLNQTAIHATQAGFSIPLGSGSGATAFNSPEIRVPLDEWWYGHRLTMQTSLLTAADVMQGFAPAVFMDPNAPSSRYHLLAPPVYRSVTGGVPLATAEQFWLPPGSVLAWACDQYTVAAGESVVADLFYSRFPI